MRSHNVEFLNNETNNLSKSFFGGQERVCDLVDRVAPSNKVSTECASQIASNMPTNPRFTISTPGTIFTHFVEGG